MSLISSVIALVFIVTGLVCLGGNILRSVSLSERPKITLEYISAELRECLLSILVLVFGWYGWFNKPPVPVSGNNDLPIILIPGYGMNSLSLWFLKSYLNASGYRWVWSINHPIAKDDLGKYAIALSEKARHLRFRSGQPKVMLIAHSMGGLVSRIAINKEPEGFSGLISLGTPWNSTAAHIFTVGNSGQQMSPDSPYLCAKWEEDVPLHSIYSKQDWIILPPTNSIVTDAHNHSINHVGHLSLLCSSVCFSKITAILKEISACNMPSSSS